jgi:hypothetical protein
MFAMAALVLAQVAALAESTDLRSPAVEPIDWNQELAVQENTAWVDRPWPTSSMVGKEPNSDEQWYIFGYGSLMMKSSRERTNCKLSGISENTVQWMEKNMASTAFKPDVAACITKETQAQFFATEANGLRRGWYAPGVVEVEGELWATQQLVSRLPADPYIH